MDLLQVNVFYRNVKKIPRRSAKLVEKRKVKSAPALEIPAPPARSEGRAGMALAVGPPPEALDARRRSRHSVAASKDAQRVRGRSKDDVFHIYEMNLLNSSKYSR